jgi:hypothetical protein
MTPVARSVALGGLGFAYLALIIGLLFPLRALRDSCAAYGIVLVSWPLWAAAVIVSIGVARFAKGNGRMRYTSLLALALNVLAFATVWLPFPGSCS